MLRSKLVFKSNAGTSVFTWENAAIQKPTASEKSDAQVVASGWPDGSMRWFRMTGLPRRCVAPAVPSHVLPSCPSAEVAGGERPGR